jgi:hypothetical protein
MAALTDLELGVLEVLRDGGAANISDLPSLLAAVPKDTGQSSWRGVSEADALEVVTALVSSGFAVLIAPGVVGWTGIVPPEWE